MKKLKLNLDDLKVESFETTYPVTGGDGTVHAQSQQTNECQPGTGDTELGCGTCGTDSYCYSTCSGTCSNNYTCGDTCYNQYTGECSCQTAPGCTNSCSSTNQCSAGLCTGQSTCYELCGGTAGPTSCDPGCTPLCW